MLASFVLHGNVPLPSNSPVQINHCTRLELDVNNRAVQGIGVEEWELPKMTADEWENEQSDIAEEWKKDQAQRIRGMCRHGLVLKYREKKGFVSPIPIEMKGLICDDVDFIMTGK
jgi:hypothetical protein